MRFAGYLMAKQVRVQLPTSAVNVALPAFAVACCAAAPCCCGASCAAIDGDLLHAGPKAANPLHTAAAGKWDRRTDTIPLHSPCTAYMQMEQRPLLVLLAKKVITVWSHMQNARQLFTEKCFVWNTSKDKM